MRCVAYPISNASTMELLGGYLIARILFQNHMCGVLLIIITLNTAQSVASTMNQVLRAKMVMSCNFLKMTVPTTFYLSYK
jgi:predicted transglutaminase-like protease